MGNIVNSSQLRLDSTSAVFSPLLFILVLEALSRDFRIGAPWELLYADDLLIIADSLEKCIARLKAWKDAMEKKSCRVNMPSSCYRVLAWMYWINQESIPVQYAVRMWDQTSFAPSANYGSIRGAMT